MKLSDIDLMAMKAKFFFEQGWSMNMSMSKAGFTSTWNGQASVVGHPIIKALKALNKENQRIKNRQGHRLSF